MLEIAPPDVDIILMNSMLCKENDVCDFVFKCNFINEGYRNIKSSGVVNLKILRLLVELRNFYLDNNQPYWKGCNFEVNLETGKIGVEFIYD